MKKQIKEVRDMCRERGLGKLFYIMNLAILQESGIEEVRRRMKLFDELFSNPNK